MDFSTKIDSLQQHVTDAKSAADSAMTESRDKLQQRIEQAQVDTHLAVMDAKQRSDEAATSTRNKWAQMKADAATHMAETRARLNKRGAQMDAHMAAEDAQWAEGDASDAIDFAAWAIDNARLATLNAIDMRLRADQLAATAARA